MLLAPIIFATIVVGIARMGNIKEVGRVGVKALLYFEVVSTLALVIGLVVVNLVRPGDGMNIDPATSTQCHRRLHAARPSQHGAPSTSSWTSSRRRWSAPSPNGAMLQISCSPLLFGVALVQLGDEARPLVDVHRHVPAHAVPHRRAWSCASRRIGAFAGDRLHDRQYGVGTLWSLGYLMLSRLRHLDPVHRRGAGRVARWAGFPLLHSSATSRTNC